MAHRLIRFPNTTTFGSLMDQVIECEASLSDRLLQAARASLHAAPDFCTELALKYWQHSGVKNQQLLLLLDCLIDASQAVAKAIEDNAWDDSTPVERKSAEDLANACYRIGAVITNASQCPSIADWSLPSMSGKELV